MKSARSALSKYPVGGGSGIYAWRLTEYRFTVTDYAIGACAIRESFLHERIKADSGFARGLEWSFWVQSCVRMKTKIAAGERPIFILKLFNFKDKLVASTR